VDVAGRQVRPALDPGEGALDARAIAPDPVVGNGVLVVDDLAGGVEHGHEVVRASEDEGVVVVRVSGSPFSVFRVTEGMPRLQPKPNGPFPELES
jgi:hypothetical protein